MEVQSPTSRNTMKDSDLCQGSIVCAEPEKASLGLGSQGCHEKK